MNWMILVEQTERMGQESFWVLGERLGPFSSQEAARERAESVAREHVPAHPWSERERAVYRLTPDSFLVDVVGLTKKFHFRVSVAEKL
ncbi:hypothetical protein [Nocardiopsis sp. NRRL B-16309]|uniref:hypothetical protein n=1 Tax=Nocardiopsis sp. NRRL B-16309 TaxID=1519494 RepID=UPI0006AE51E0|nr:hypothetical protein [Nocardiopsis sp. NRRL B-16309]KOX17551.1 hypothetical protein ADL05_09375 [Nocardiopsis sp. NRRL B-16309]